MTENENREFEQIVKRAGFFGNRRPPAKFPELRYLWGITLLGSFIAIVVVSLIATLAQSL